MGRRLSFGLFTAGVVWFSAMGCGDDDATNPTLDAGPGLDSAVPVGDSSSPDATGLPTKIACTALLGFTIPASDIALPTTGAVVTAAIDLPDGDGGTGSSPAHCLVTGNILPMDPAAPNIKIAVALPPTWNNKAIFLGGGGFDGALTDVTTQVPNSLPTSLSPLARGYAVFGSDGGHESTATVGFADATTFVNDEAYLNWLRDSPKKSHDAAMAIIKAHYGAAPQKTYAAGGSTGGREVLMAISRSGADYDGAIAYYPGRPATVGILGYVNLSQAMATPGAFPSPAKRNVLWQAILAACDSLDGAADGVVSDPTTCSTTFDPSVTRCTGGADTGDTCLSDVQLAALARVHAPLTFNQTMPDGEADFPGFPVYSGSMGTGTTLPIEATVEAFDLGAVVPTFPVTPTVAPSAQFADGFFRYAVTRDTTFDYLTMDVKGFGTAAARVAAVGAFDTADTDLSVFSGKNAKLLMVQGTADMLVPTAMTERYVAGIRSKLGATATDAFFRYYEVAGFQHGVSATFLSAWDSLTALESWVEKGTDPAENEVTTDLIGVPGRTRPLCRYPAFPKYNGTGDMNLAASFTCFTKP